MAAPKPNREFLLLQRLQRFKQSPGRSTPRLGDEMISFFKQSVEKPHKKLGRISEAWAQLIPQHLADHTCLEGYHRGTLTVLVDSSSHLYELKQLLLAGIQQQLLLSCKSAGLRKVNLKPGRWYSGESPEDRKVSFE